MRTLFIFLMLALVVSPLIPTVFSTTVGVPEGVLRNTITSIKFLDAYFGTSQEKLKLDQVTKTFHLQSHWLMSEPKI